MMQDSTEIFDWDSDSFRAVKYTSKETLVDAMNARIKKFIDDNGIEYPEYSEPVAGMDYMVAFVEHYLRGEEF